MADPSGTTTTTYDSLNRPETVTNAAGRLVTYAYDPVRRRTGMTDPDGGRFTYSYDAATGRMDYLVNPQAERTTFSYDPADRLLTKQLANGTRTTHIYDLDGRLTRLDHVQADGTVLDSLTYSFNQVGVRTKLVEANGAGCHGHCPCSACPGLATNCLIPTLQQNVRRRRRRQSVFASHG